ncbi:ABC-ATPase domain-containing protein [Salicibibacter cibarius]|uniref:ABC-ATPase domain-containing protein n=1 Tax=Salicibibacter cibarius TaxID=2743000 RepID=A0A7T7CBX3_9BACI|nr:ABC-ATPase domain-containing protein [Salicibibacter cibarius]QQK76310.1 ABC-ATPase domain-containing protein [Salicibibacter cibarius]
MKQLQQTLERIDRKGYKAYNDIRGTFTFPSFRLHLDHIQADPYASPSRARVEIPHRQLHMNEALYESGHRNVAFTDYVARSVGKAIRKQKAEKSLFIDRPGQEILERTAVVCDKEKVEIRLSIHLPARGRTIMGVQAAKLLTEQLPSIIEQALFNIDMEGLKNHVALSDDQDALRAYVKERDALAFVADGSILPRASGVENRPLDPGRAIPFESPETRAATVSLPHSGDIRGMLIPKGVHVIVGGGYHGKSTLLEALERGIYNHIDGDGRAFIVTDTSACKIRAEDGRGVTNVNISPFIDDLPNQKSTDRFQTDNASGSTSQATNIIESLEAGSRLLLIDEDTSATNFMIRDYRMQQLVSPEKEPITPFIDRVRDLYEEEGVSTIIVVGGTGDYFDVADTVTMMDAYRPYDVTGKAKEIAEKARSQRITHEAAPFTVKSTRYPLAKSFDAQRGKKEKVDARGKHTILYGRETIDLSAVEQCIDPSQTRAIARALHYLAKQYANGNHTLGEMLDIYERDTASGLDELSPFKGKHPGDLARPRRFEIAAAINRLRTLSIARDR